MTSHRGPLRIGESNAVPSKQSSVVIRKREVVLSPEDKAYIHHVRRKAKELRELASPSRFCAQGSDNVSLETEGTGISTLTGSSSSAERKYNINPRSRDMSPAQYTIFEDELQSRAAQSSYISRPIDVDSMQEYEDGDEDLKPPRVDFDDSRSRTTTSTYSSRPIDVDSVLEYDPEEYPETRLPEERFEKIMNFNNGYYEGESLLEYSSDDESVDFETGFAADSKKGRDGPERNVASLKQLETPSQNSHQFAVSVDLVGPIHLDTSHLLAQDEGFMEEASFRDWEFPILDEREFDRELVGYMEGCEPIVEDLPPRSRLGGRKQSDATSTRSSNTRVTFEI